MLGAGGFARELLETIEIINKNTEDEIVPIGYVMMMVKRIKVN